MTKEEDKKPSLQEKFFFEVISKVQNDLTEFKAPTYKRINLVWIDMLKGDLKKIQDLKKLMNSDSMNSGHPVFVSLCMSDDEIENFIEINGFSDMSIRIIPQEMFSIFDENGNMLTHYYLNFNKLFKKEQELYFYLPIKKLPIEFKGNFKIQNYN